MLADLPLLPTRFRRAAALDVSTPRKRVGFNRAQLFLLIAGWLVVLPALFLPIRVHVDAEFRERLMDAVHLPFFAAFTFFAAMVLPFPRLSDVQRIWAAGGCALAFAAAVEGIQPLTGRCESLRDFRDGAFGVFLAVTGFLLWRRLAPAALRIGHAFAVAGMIAWTLLPAGHEFRGLWWRHAHFPLLADFESDAEMRLWVVSDRDDGPGQGARVSTSSEFASRGSHSLRVEIAGGQYPGVRLLTGEQDWRGRTAFAFDLYNPGAPFELSLRIDDDAPVLAHSERYNGAVPIASGWNAVRVPMERIVNGPKTRPLRMQAIRRVLFFLNAPAEPHVFYLDHVRLE